MKGTTKNAIRKLGRMKLRTLAISLVVSLAMALVVSGLYGAEVLDATVDQYFEDGRMADVFVSFSEVQDDHAVTASLDANDAIDVYQTRLLLEGAYTFEGEVLKAIFIGIDDLEDQRINRLEVLDGALPAAGDAVAISGMEFKGADTGDQMALSIGETNFTLNLSGLVSSPEYLFSGAYSDYSVFTPGSQVVVLMAKGDLQAVTGVDGVNNVVMGLKEGADSGAVIADLEIYGIDAVVEQNQHPSRQFMDIGSDKLRNMFPMIGAIFMFIGFISVFMTMYRLVQNDTRSIGVLMAMGHERRDIVRSYMVMGLIVGGVGLILGVVLGIVLTQSMITASMTLYIQDVQIALPFSVMPFLIAGVATVGMVLFSVWVPTMMITGQTVRDALEYRPRSRVFTPRMGVGAPLSGTTKLGLRNTTRNPGRTLITVVVVGLTIGVAGSWLFMGESALDYMVEQIEADTWDLRVDFSSPQLAANVTEAGLGLAAGSTEYVMPFTYLVGEASAAEQSEGITLLAPDDPKQTRDFVLNDGELDFSGAVVNERLANELGVEIGDSIDITVGPNTVEMEVTGLITDIQLGSIYTARSSTAGLYPIENATGAFVQMAAGATVDDAALVLRGQDSIANVLVHDDITRALEELIGLATSFFAAFFLISASITIVVAGAAVIISTMERDIEFATLDTLGISRGKVIRSIMVEMSLLGILSAIIAIPLAYFTAQGMALLLAEVIFYFPIFLALGASMITFVGGVAFVMISAFVPVRYSGKLSTEQTLRERTAG